MANNKKSCSYICHKWSLFGLCFALVYLELMLVLFAVFISNQSPHEYRKIIYRKILVESGITVLLAMLGAIGAYRESYCLTSLFSVFTTLSVIAQIYSSIISPIFWFITLFFMFVTMVSFSFARHIRERLLKLLIEPQLAFARDNGPPYGATFNSIVFSNDNTSNSNNYNNIDGYNNNNNQQFIHMHNMPTFCKPPPYEEMPPYPPPYDDNSSQSTSAQNCVTYI
ncbi:uncharacterized protein LOC128958220 [Oppia nitens]|uniref:uncharacterized protein LOC128958220 n=1 Tax=Oppia nitens TaxID=1686743 RepID=UPI0023DC1C40|nr:uncharacterized protein LOC128958220 [Oppia nitens]